MATVMVEMAEHVDNVCGLLTERDAALRTNPNEAEREALRQVQERLNLAEAAMNSFKVRHGLAVRITQKPNPVTNIDGSVSADYEASFSTGYQLID